MKASIPKAEEPSQLLAIFTLRSASTIFGPCVREQTNGMFLLGSFRTTSVSLSPIPRLSDDLSNWASGSEAHIAAMKMNSVLG
jgi:hypothetical protein